jgi:cobalt-zinc-cadmium efflux system protein
MSDCHHDQDQNAHDCHGHDHEGHDHEGHDHGHHHQHGIGGHGHAPADFGRAFAIGIALNVAYVAAEAFYGVAAHSLALLADAGHNLGDVLGLVAAWGAAILSRRSPGGRYTYGLRGSSILAALGNAIALLIVTGGIGWEAVRRLMTPEPSSAVTIMVVAAVGVVLNGGTALLFMSGRRGDLNIKGAFTHMAADALISFGVVLAAGLIAATGWQWLDPAVSLAVSAIIVAGTWSLLRDSLDLALDAVPPGIDPEAVEHHLATLAGVVQVHDLHIWGMSTTETALTAHLVRSDPSVDDAFLRLAAQDMKDRFGIGHATFQIEVGDGEECVLAPNGVV